MPHGEPDNTSRLVRAYVAVGSNIQPERNIPRAMRMLKRRARIVGTSTFYRTPAIGRPEQAEFVNGVWAVETDIPPRTMKFAVLRGIEQRLGRVRSADACADRTIDLDLVLYGDEAIDEPDLKVPHPDLVRPFVALPLLELDGGALLPGTRQRLSCIKLRPKGISMVPLPGLTAKLKRGTGQ
jgi:2-amino-4-hydroxy-6-hydroxymethyldihydropteridine diphosphokinase